MKQNKIILTPTSKTDLETLHLFQLNQEANYLAAFTSPEPLTKEAYINKYTPFLSNPTIHMCTIWIENQIVGSIAKYETDNQAEITYWIDHAFWGRGIATNALQEFLKLELMRPIYGRVAFDNIGSQKVLEYCGFKKIGIDTGFAKARNEEIEEYIYIRE
mgnify:FL=1